MISLNSCSANPPIPVSTDRYPSTYSKRSTSGHPSLPWLIVSPGLPPETVYNLSWSLLPPVLHQQTDDLCAAAITTPTRSRSVRAHRQAWASSHHSRHYCREANTLGLWIPFSVARNWKYFLRATLRSSELASSSTFRRYHCRKALLAIPRLMSSIASTSV